MEHTIKYARRKVQKDSLLECSLLDYLNKLQRGSDGSLVRMDKSGGSGRQERPQQMGKETAADRVRESKQDGKEVDDEGMSEVAEDEGAVPDSLESLDMVLDEEVWEENKGSVITERLEKVGSSIDAECSEPLFGSVQRSL